ncbi:MAG: hypothetical protein HEP69_15650 [Aestuariivita sp.]|nr:hypothetical protein [Aestuariivita sp.]
MTFKDSQPISSTLARLSVRSCNARSVLSVLPKISMKGGGKNILFWRAQAGEGANAQPNDADRLQAVRAWVDEIDHDFHQLLDRVRSIADQKDSAAQRLMREAYAALRDLQAALERAEIRLAALQSGWVDNRDRLLAGWRMTENEILSVDAGALRSDLEALFQAVRRQQVSIAAMLIEFD